MSKVDVVVVHERTKAELGDGNATTVRRTINFCISLARDNEMMK